MVYPGAQPEEVEGSIIVKIEEQVEALQDVKSVKSLAASEAASLSMGTSPPSIRRQDGQRVVTVIADVDESVISSGEANGILEDTILAELIAANPELTYSFGGEQKQLESLASLYRGFVLAMARRDASGPSC